MDDVKSRILCSMGVPGRERKRDREEGKEKRKKQWKKKGIMSQNLSNITLEALNLLGQPPLTKMFALSHKQLDCSQPQSIQDLGPLSDVHV